MRKKNSLICHTQVDGEPTTSFFWFSSGAGGGALPQLPLRVSNYGSGTSRPVSLGAFQESCNKSKVFGGLGRCEM